MNGFNMHMLFKAVMFIGILNSGLTQTSKEYYTRPGDTVILLCKIQKDSSPIVDWTFLFNATSSIQYSSSGNINFNLPEKIKVRLSIVAEDGLQISNIEKDDEGSYMCSSNINGELRQHLSILSIVTPPTALVIQNVKDEKVSGTEGLILALNCTAVGGKPPPEVKLTVSGVSVSVTGNQSVQYANQQVPRNFDKQTVTCTVNHSESSSMLQNTALIYLNLKPLMPTFDQSSLSTEETIPLTASCTSEGSRPPASFQWYIGSTNITSFAKDTNSSTQSTETYTVHSILIYHVNRSHNRKEVTCKVTNIADLNGTQERRQLNVKYAPDITVNSPNYTQNDDIRIVTCNPSGNPNNYTYHKWQHKSKYGDLIQEWFVGNKTLKLSDASVLLRYQDTGEYVCTASNGIKGKNNMFKQTGSGYVIVKAQPVFTSDNKDKVKQFGEIGKAVEIYVNVYSVPKFTSLKWECDGKPKITLNSAKYTSSSSPTIVKDVIQLKEVKLDGYNVTLTIHDLKAEDFTNYTVTLKNGFPVDVKYTIILESASVPETPGNFSRIASSSTSITVQWDPNSGGGYKQTFKIQYRVKGLLEWTTVSAGEEDVNQQKRKRTFEVKNLLEGKAYELRMYAENEAEKRSNVTDVLTAFTDSGVEPSVAAIVGGIAGGLTAIIIVLLVIVFVQRKRKENGTRSKKLRASPGEKDEEEDGLKDNILYESSQSDGLKKNILCQSADLNDDHVAVTKNQKKSSTSSEYASVQKPNAIYAEVNKVTQSKNAKEKKQKDKKIKPKKTRKEKAKGLNNNPEEEYANSALQLKNFNDGEYANSTDTQGPSGHQTNAQGLEYADLTFRQIPTQNKKQVIHGVDERTIYADVDHTKKAPPPPQESEYEETNIKHGKMA